MRRFIIFILLFCSVNMFGQFLPGVKHIEIVSELQDSMILLNKPDVDKINRMYFEKEKLDSINTYNEKIMELLEEKIHIQDSIIINNNVLLNNEIELHNYLKKRIDDNTTQYEKYLKREKAKKVGWQITTGVAVIGIIIALAH